MIPFIFQLNEEPPQELSKSALKNKKKREAKLRSKQEDGAPEPEAVSQPTAEPVRTQQSSALNPEQEKKLKNLRKVSVETSCIPNCTSNLHVAWYLG